MRASLARHITRSSPLTGARQAPALRAVLLSLDPNEVRFRLKRLVLPAAAVPKQNVVGPPAPGSQWDNVRGIVHNSHFRVVSIEERTIGSEFRTHRLIVFVHRN